MHRAVSAEFLKAWQAFADRVADAAQVPAALVMRVWPKQIEVLVTSLGAGNPYEAHERIDLGTGLYCETVMRRRESLQVSDARSDPDWAHNPDVKLGMISYLGVPLLWPDDSIFGTVCVLDRKSRNYDAKTLRLLQALQALIEDDFRLIDAGQSTPPERYGPHWQAFERCLAERKAERLTGACSPPY